MQPEILGSAKASATVVPIHECPEGNRRGIEESREERYINRLSERDSHDGRGVQTES